MSWKTILVPHDFSSAANHAAAIARDEAKLHGGTLVLLHVIELPHQMGDAMVVGDGSATPISMREYATTRAQAHLEDIIARLGKDGVTATPLLKVGVAVDEINQAVEDHKIDLVVMGTHGRTGLRHLVAGSITERVVRSCRVPVLTIRHAE